MPTESISFKIGQDSIEILVYRGKKTGIVYFNMHDDENTSAEVAKNFTAKYGGTFVELRQTGQRLISFRIGNETYKFDPNRIFTKVGIEKTLTNYGKYTKEAAKEVERFSKHLTDQYLSNVSTVVAMHNNTNNAYSVLSYQSGGEFENDALKVFTAPQNDIDDFFYVTSADVFNSISSMGYNVVLQNNAKVTDDGSLSVFSGLNNINYINVEAEHGHGDQQLKMLLSLREVIGK